MAEKKACECENKKAGGDGILKRAIMLELSAPVPQPSNKISIIGVGNVGMAIAMSILAQGVSKDVAFCDRNETLARAEMLDLQQGSMFLKNARINASSDYAVTAGSRICVITAGARIEKDQSRLAIAQTNANILKSIVPALMKHNPDTIIIMVTNPCDVLAYVAWKLSGLPKHKILGSGTMLDTSRFRYFISQRLGLSANNCHGYIIGEHGDSSVAVWSDVNAAGIRLVDAYPKIGTNEDVEKWGDLHQEVVRAAYEIVTLKGYTSWAIGLCVSQLCEAMFNNAGAIHPVSVYCKGMHGIQDDVFLSLPSVLGRDGIVSIIKQKLNPEESKKIQNSAKVLSDVIKSLTL